MENTEVTRMNVASMLICGCLIFKVQLEREANARKKMTVRKKERMKA
jgi:hypothetical protein